MAGKISGIVTIDGSPIETSVRVYEAQTGVFIDKTQRAADGFYESVTDNELPVFVMVDPPDGYMPICHGPLIPSFVYVDFYANNVASLVHFDWLGDETIISDDINNHNWSIKGSANVSQGLSKFGSASLQCVSLGGATAEYHSSFDVGLADTTFEAWVHIPANVVASYANILPIYSAGVQHREVGGFTFYLLIVSGGYQLVTRATDDNKGNGYDIHTSDVFPLSSGWHHAAWARQGNNSYLFINGALVGSSIFTSPLINPQNQKITVGYAQWLNSSYSAFIYSGNHAIDELRITTGVARYTESFTPLPFPFIA